MLLLAESLDVPLRERNRLLRAAGFADHYRETTLDDPELAAARRALQFILERHEPFPAAVVGPSWEVRMANRAALRLIAYFAPDAAAPPDLLRAQAPFFRLVLERGDLRLALFTTIATFGTPHDVTLQELRLETFFACDEETEAALRQLAG